MYKHLLIIILLAVAVGGCGNDRPSAYEIAERTIQQTKIAQQKCQIKIDIGDKDSAMYYLGRATAFQESGMLTFNDDKK